MSFSLVIDSFLPPFFRNRWVLQPWYLEEPLVEGLEISPDNPLLAIKTWVEANKTKQYKFVGILLNTETLSFERTLKDFLLENENLLKQESGPEFLILHPYVGRGTKHGNENVGSQANLTYTYIQGLGIDTLDLPVILVFPLNGMEVQPDQHDNPSLVIVLEKAKQAWLENKQGNEQDYLAYVFRCLFEAIKAVPKSDPFPVKTLESAFETRLNKKTGPTWSKLIMKDIPNLPIIKEWILPLIKLGGKFAGT